MPPPLDSGVLRVTGRHVDSLPTASLVLQSYLVSGVPTNRSLPPSSPHSDPSSTRPSLGCPRTPCRLTVREKTRNVHRSRGSGSSRTVGGSSSPGPDRHPSGGPSSSRGSPRSGVSYTTSRTESSQYRSCGCSRTKSEGLTGHWRGSRRNGSGQVRRHGLGLVGAESERVREGRQDVVVGGGGSNHDSGPLLDSPYPTTPVLPERRSGTCEGGSCRGSG